MSDDDIGQSEEQETPVPNGGMRPLLGRVFAALANRRRRYVLYCLRDHDQAQVEDLAVQITAWEEDCPIPEAPVEDVERVRSELVHSHLPKLEDYDLIEYDPRSETVRYTYPPSLLEEAVELSATFEKPRNDE